MAAVSAQTIRARAREAIFAAGGRGFVRFLPEGGALLVSDAARRCGDVRTILNACRTAGFAAEERDGLLLLTPTDSTLSALCGACGQAVRITDWDEEKASAAAFSVRLTRRKDAPLTADGRRLVLETLRLLSQDDAHILMGMAGIRARADSSHSHQYMRIILTEQPQGFQHEPASVCRQRRILSSRQPHRKRCG